jgi:hypothetical protein
MTSPLVFLAQQHFTNSHQTLETFFVWLWALGMGAAVVRILDEKQQRVPCEGQDPVRLWWRVGGLECLNRAQTIVHFCRNSA